MPRKHEEAGAVAVITAIVLGVLLMVSAFVIDLGALRADHVAGKAAADMASSAGVVGYDPTVPGAAREACLNALEYAVENVRDLDAAPSGTPSCEDLFELDEACSDDWSERTAVYANDTFRVSITLPVDDDNPLMGGQAVDEDFDGNRCERLAVRIERDRDFLIAPAGGADALSGSTRPGSVALRHTGAADEFVSLVVLQREGCRTLRGSGGSTLRVFDLVTADETFPGRITIDTLPDCTGQNRVITAPGSGIIEASGDILSFGLERNPGSTQIFDPSDVPDSLTPQPKAGPLISRQTIDHLFNCQTDSGGYSAQGSSNPYDPMASHVANGESKVGPCPAGSEEYEARYGRSHPGGSYISALHQNLIGVDAGTSGWSVFPDDADPLPDEDEADCDAGGVIEGTAGDRSWYVDCEGQGNAGFEPGELVVTGVDHLVVPEGLDLSGDVSINAGGYDPGTVLFIQSEGLNRNGGNADLRDTFIYLADRDEGWGMTGSSGRFSLKAPLDEGLCADPGGVPNASCFAPLTLWSNYVETNVNQGHRLEGDASGGIIGTVFTPNAPFRFRGEGDDSTEPCSGDVTWDEIGGAGAGSFNLEGSQFYAEVFDAAGGASVRLCPSPGSTVAEPVTGTRLIR